MFIAITHVAKTDPTDPRSQIVEIGAMTGSSVLWRCTSQEAIARIRSGVRYFMDFDGHQVAVEVAPATLLDDARLRTVRDGCAHSLLSHLPQLPKRSSGIFR
ncbi:hypothetical protein [Variovorax guangxiensis]|uniref:hypothetical protein n=1 Tax=Variovorax guangxiensis TaxID=1775474 RepID=UPI00285C1B35|nr:hypothetical protein [Variovorax guangxiensis]MDR6859840.1 hypothetical protein [Variovorax guangxiensis]